MKVKLTITTMLRFNLVFLIQRLKLQVFPIFLPSNHYPDPHTPLIEGQSSPIPDYTEDYEEEVDAYTNHDLVEKAFEVGYFFGMLK